MSEFGVSLLSNPYSLETRGNAYLESLKRYYGHQPERKTRYPPCNSTILPPRLNPSGEDVEHLRSSRKIVGFRPVTTTGLRNDIKLITIDYRQKTPWCRDLYRWFTPDPGQGVWLDSENFDKYRLQACKQRLTAGNRIYHVHQGLIPGYYGHVPGQKFRHGNAWTIETKNACNYNAERQWESTSIFETRPIGP